MTEVAGSVSRVQAVTAPRTPRAPRLAILRPGVGGEPHQLHGVTLEGAVGVLHLGLPVSAVDNPPSLLAGVLLSRGRLAPSAELEGELLALLVFAAAGEVSRGPGPESQESDRLLGAGIHAGKLAPLPASLLR